MDEIQPSSSPKSKMASSYRLRCLSWVLETNLKEEVCRGFIFANLFDSLYLSVRLWWNILVANLATNFQDLVAKGKNLVALAPVLGAISRPVGIYVSPDTSTTTWLWRVSTPPHTFRVLRDFISRGEMGRSWSSRWSFQGLFFKKLH